MIKIIIAFSFSMILFISSIPILAIAKTIYTVENNIENEKHNIITLGKKKYKDLLFVCGKISNLEILEDEIDEDFTKIRLNFFAENVYIRGGHPARAGGWGVVPPTFYDEWITQENISVVLEEDEMYYEYVTKGIITTNFIFLFQLYGSLPFSKLFSLLWISVAPFLNNIYPDVEPILNKIVDFFLDIHDIIRHNELYIRIYHFFDPLRDLIYEIYSDIREFLIPILNDMYERWFELRHRIDDIFDDDKSILKKSP